MQISACLYYVLFGVNLFREIVEIIWCRNHLWSHKSNVLCFPNTPISFPFPGTGAEEVVVLVCYSVTNNPNSFASLISHFLRKMVDYKACS